LTAPDGFSNLRRALGQPLFHRRLPGSCEKFLIFDAGGHMVPAPVGKPPFEGLRTAGLLLAIPTLLIVSPLVGFFLGNALDGWLKTGRVLGIVGLVLGFGAAGREVTRIYRRYLAEEKERNQRP